MIPVEEVGYMIDGVRRLMTQAQLVGYTPRCVKVSMHHWRAFDEYLHTVAARHASAPDPHAALPDLPDGAVGWLWRLPVYADSPPWVGPAVGI